MFGKGGDGGVELAQKVVEACEKPSDFCPIYDIDLTVKEKIEAIAKNIYGAANVEILPEAQKKIEDFTKAGFGNTPVCIAKTQYSLSDNLKVLGRPEGFTLTVRDIWLSAGAGFLVALTGAIVTMPGLPKHPAAMDIDIDANGVIEGLF